MPKLMERPTVVEAAGKLPKRIERIVVRGNTGPAGASTPAFSPETVRRDA